MESYTSTTINAVSDRRPLDNDCEGCIGATAAVVSRRRRREQLRKRWEAFGSASKGLLRPINLLWVLYVILFGSSGQGFPTARAFSVSSQTTRLSQTTPSFARNSALVNNGQILNRIRNYDCGIIPRNGVDNEFRQDRPQNPKGSWALYSTTERSAPGSRATASLPSQFVTTNGSFLNTTNVTAIQPNNGRSMKTERASKIMNDPFPPKIPRHVGLICDGNGRWATQRNLPRAAGHLEGARRLVDLVRSILKERDNKRSRSTTKNYSSNHAVDCLTLYAFSTENWNRSPSEIAKIFEAIEVAATAVKNEVAEVDLRVLGDLSDPRIPASLRKLLQEMEDRTQHRRKDSHTHADTEHHRLQVCLAVNYGGRRDIVSACRSLAESVRDGTLEASDITEEALQEQLATGGIPPPDLIVRTGGEHRLSNFLLWEAAYAELYVSQILWPDFSFDGEWKDSLEWYSKRKRNFGGRAEHK